MTYFSRVIRIIRFRMTSRFLGESTSPVLRAEGTCSKAVHPFCDLLFPPYLTPQKGYFELLVISFQNTNEILHSKTSVLIQRTYDFGRSRSHSFRYFINNFFCTKWLGSFRKDILFKSRMGTGNLARASNVGREGVGTVHSWP